MKKILILVLVSGVFGGIVSGVKSACSPPECTSSAQCGGAPCINSCCGQLCTPGEKNTWPCGSGGCAADEQRECTCNSSGTAWGDCSCKNDSSCGGCTESPWVNQACGTVVNGCGYETMRQTRMEACGGATTQCVANVACLWPGRVQGQIVQVGGGSPPSSTVTMDATTAVANPSFNFSLADINPGTTHTVSVSNPAYDIGYSVCYNNTSCHGAITTGASLSVPDANIRANGPMYANPYADVTA